jgi:hypothetical protein
MALIPLLEITEIREFKITNGSVSLSDHVSPIIFDVPKPLCCISCTVSFWESLRWRYTTTETELIPLFHNLNVMISSYSRTETARSHSRHGKTGLSPSWMMSLFLSLNVLNTIFYSLLYLLKIHSIWT